MPKWDLTRAARRYAAKCEGSVVTTKLTAALSQMHANYTTDSNAQYALEAAIKGAIPSTSGVTVAQTAYYMAFGKAIMRLTRRYSTSGDIVTNAADDIINRYVSRGLDSNILELIKHAVFSIASPV